MQGRGQLHQRWRQPQNRLQLGFLLRTPRFLFVATPSHDERLAEQLLLDRWRVLPQVTRWRECERAHEPKERGCFLG